MHFTLKRSDRGDYSVELTPKHYVEIDGNAADNGMLVPPHATFRLGNETGPTFSADVAKPALAGEVTDENVYVAPVREKIAQAEGEIGHVKKYGTYAFAGLAAVVCAAVVVGVVRDVRHANEVQQLAANLAAADDRLTQLAESQIDESEQKAVLAAVYLVAKVEGGKDVGKATAWAFAPDKLATNAHVTSQINVGKDNWVLIGPNGERIPIKSVDSHPGYSKFKAYLDRIGGTVGSEFKRLDVINEYDVGIIHPAEPLPVDSAGKTATLDVASARRSEEFGTRRSRCRCRLSHRGHDGDHGGHGRAGHAAFRQYQLVDRRVHVPGQPGAQPAHPAYGSGHGGNERKPAGRRHRQGHRRRERRHHR